MLGLFRRDHGQFFERISADNVAFDARYGVTTAGRIPVEAYKEVPDDKKIGAQGYGAVHERVLNTLIDALVPDAEEFDFIDIGSGKGKALLVASMHPFRRVRGVELSPPLHEAALANIRAFASGGHMVCTDVQSECKDAREVTDFGPKTLVFMANPFDEAPMAAFVQRLETELRGRSAVIAYLLPKASGPFDRSPVFRNLLTTMRLAVYGTEGVTLSHAARAVLTRKFDAWRL